jgi:hypothetical protein
MDLLVILVTGSSTTRVRLYTPENAGLVISKLINLSVKVIKLGNDDLSVISTEVFKSTSQSS